MKVFKKLFLSSMISLLFVAATCMSASAGSSSTVVADIYGSPLPEVVRTDPYNAEKNVDIERPIIIDFSKSVVSYNVKVTVKEASGKVLSTQQTLDNSARVRVTGDMKYDTKYNVTVRVEHKILPQYETYNFSFTTEKDLRRSIISTDPSDKETDVDVDSPIIIKFSGDIDSYDVSVKIKDNKGHDIDDIRQKRINRDTVKVIAELDYGKTYRVSVKAVPEGEPASRYDYETFSFTTECREEPPEPIEEFPEVISTTPSNGAENVSINASIQVKYSRPISQYGYIVTIKDEENNTVQRQVSKANNTITIIPSLTYNTWYQVSVKLTLPDEEGPQYTFHFTTGANSPSWPQVLSTNPEDGDTGVDTDSKITITYNKSISAYGTLIEITDENNNKVDFEKNTSDDSDTIEIGADLKENTRYYVSIKLIKDSESGTVYNFDFKTEGDSPDDDLPEVEYTKPRDGKSNVDPDEPIIIRFSKDIEDDYDVQIKIRNLDESEYIDEDDFDIDWEDEDEISIDADIEYETEYRVYVKLLDEDGDAIPGAKTYTFEFETEDEDDDDYDDDDYDYDDRFSDVSKNHWAYKAITYMARRGIISGFSDGTFRPDDEVTREQFAKIMVLALDLPLKNPSTPTFEDIDRSHWAYRYVESAKEYLTGYIEGNDLYYYGDEDAVREDVAVALVKAKGYSVSSSSTSRLDDIFTDADEISEDLRKYVLTAYNRGLIKGYTNRTFRPQGTLTRAEAAHLIYEASIID